MFWLLAAQLSVSQAESKPYALTLGLGTGGGSWEPGFTAAALGTGHLEIQRDGVHPLIGAREGIATSDLRALSNVHAGVAFHRGEGWQVQVLFTHNHEVPWAALMAAPLASVLGTGDEIRHRTGLELGIAHAWAADSTLPYPIQPLLSSHVLLFPDTKGPHAYLFIELALRAGFGRD